MVSCRTQHQKGTRTPRKPFRIIGLRNDDANLANPHPSAINISKSMKNPPKIILLAVACIGVAASAQAQPRTITNGLVVHLTFDNTVADNSGRGNNGTYNSSNSLMPNPPTSPTYVAGKLGQSFQFTTALDASLIDFVTLGSGSFTSTLTLKSFCAGAGYFREKRATSRSRAPPCNSELVRISITASVMGGRLYGAAMGFSTRSLLTKIKD